MRNFLTKILYWVKSKFKKKMYTQQDVNNVQNGLSRILGTDVICNVTTNNSQNKLFCWVTRNNLQINISLSILNGDLKIDFMSITSSGVSWNKLIMEVNLLNYIIVDNLNPVKDLIIRITGNEIYP